MSPNIFYTGATTNQQIIPGLDYLKEKGLTKIYLVGSDYVFPRTANKEIKAYAAANGLEILGEEYLAAGRHQRPEHRPEGARRQAPGRVQHPQRRHQRGLLQGAEGQGQHAGEDPDHLGVDRRGGDGRRRRRQPGRPPGGVELLPDHRQPRNKEFVAAFKAEYGADKHTDDPIEAGYNSVYIWKAAVEKAGTFDVAAVTKAAGGLVLDTPEGTLTVHPTNHHVFKTARIGMVNSSGLIDEVWNSGTPDRPRPLPRHLPLGARGLADRRGPRRVRRGQGGRLAG